MSKIPRHLAIGDIHGCFTALVTLAECVPLRPDDLLITLGDYVNRGPDSRAVLDWLIERQATSNLVALRGNHEIMLLAARDSLSATDAEIDVRVDQWLGVGGFATLASYAHPGDAGRLADIPAAHWQFLEGTRDWHEIDTHFFVHANADANFALADQPEYMLFWERFENPPPHESGKIMVCGHTSQRSGMPLNLGHAVCIDTWAYGGGWLTCLDVGSGKYWQANQQGETRSAFLE